MNLIPAHVWAVFATFLTSLFLGLPTGSTAGAPSAVSPHHPTVLGKHMFWPASGAAPSTDQVSPTNMIYHGGAVELSPSVYIVYWGPAWKNGFSVRKGKYTYTNLTVQNYVETFFANIGGSKYAGTQTQYCQNIDPPAFSCTGQPGAEFVTNPTGQLKGIWVDPSPVPAQIITTGLGENATDDPLETEAKAAAAHFGYHQDATYFIYTQPGTQATAYGSVYCAYHSETGHGPTDRGIRYAFMPYVPENGCYAGYNKDDAFGHGYLDGMSLVSGHEWGEAITDPDNQMGTQDGWNDFQTNENGDKCTSTVGNITLANGQYFHVQALWSNEAAKGQGACAFSRGTD